MRRKNGVTVEVIAHALGERNTGAVLWAAMAFPVPGQGVDAPLGVVDDIAMTLPS